MTRLIRRIYRLDLPVTRIRETRVTFVIFVVIFSILIYAISRTSPLDLFTVIGLGAVGLCIVYALIGIGVVTRELGARARPDAAATEQLGPDLSD